jgi:serine/threonine protein kinase
MDPPVLSETSPRFAEIPGYKIVQFLAQGGMGEVFLGMDENLNRPVAIKIINSEFSNNSECLQRFIREGRIIAGFRHSNIVIVYASDWKNPPYIVMEYVNGGTLAQRMVKTPLSTKEALLIGERMADALTYAHAADVIHRDFKPGNVLLRQDGTPVLSDFGIAKSVDTTGLKTEFGRVIGSRGYMAPEQAMDSSNLTDRADVYSFGIVLHEMLTGQPPKHHPVTNPSEDTEITRTVGGSLGELIGRCLNIEPAARPSAAECRLTLESCLQEVPSNSPRIRLITAVGTALLLVAAGVLLWGGGSFMRSHLASRNTVSTPLNSAAPIALTLNRIPAAAKIFVDDNETNGLQIMLPPGAHRIVAVAPRYFGESKRIQLAPGSGAQSVSFALDPTSLPTALELERFSQLADAKTLSDSELTELTDRTFQNVLRAKFLSATRKNDDLGALIADIDSLRRLGDSRAAVAAFLLDSMHAGHIGRSQVTQSLVNASNEGDAMASLFLAVSYRDTMNQVPSGITPSDPMMQQYCDRLRLASKQGWDDVAAEYLRRDHCS